MLFRSNYNYDDSDIFSNIFDHDSNIVMKIDKIEETLKDQIMITIIVMIMMIGSNLLLDNNRSQQNHKNQFSHNNKIEK